MKKIINLERFIPNKTVREWVEFLIFAAIFLFVSRSWLWAAYKVPTGSMIGTIEIGDHLFVNKHAYGFAVPFTDYKFASSKVERGDIVVFPNPTNPSIDFIKRIVAVGGDTVELAGENIYINGKMEMTPGIYYDPTAMPVVFQGKFTVPEGKLFAVGDNRRNSHDSRFWGFVDEKKVAGKGQIVFWSHDQREGLFGGYNLNRIGTILK